MNHHTFYTPSFGDEDFDLAPNTIANHWEMQTNEMTDGVTTSIANNQFSPAPTFLPNAEELDSTVATEDDKSGVVDPNKPAKPISAYALFFRDTVSAIKVQNPNVSFAEISKIVASMWDALDIEHKNVYKKKNEIAKKEYSKAMAIYRSNQLNDVNATSPANSSPQTQSFQVASKPAVFTIQRSESQSSTSTPFLPNSITQSPPQQTATAMAPVTNTTPISAVPMQPPNLNLVSEAGSAQKCIRDACTNRAIVNPDWEDEYCSNECVVAHCRNVFSNWVQSNQA